jgi:hypothetical protein
MFNSKRERRTHPTLFRKRVVSLQFECIGINLNAKIHDRTRLVVKNKKKVKSRNVIAFLVRTVAIPFFLFLFFALTVYERSGHHMFTDLFFGNDVSLNE